MRDYNNRRSSDKIWAQEDRFFHRKDAIFPSFSSVTMTFVSPIRLISFVDPLHQKIAKPDVGSCQSSRIDTFLGEIPLKV